MTEGTSQGTMILVAIIIFGIFVVLAYYLFEDRMRNMIDSMFDQVETITNQNLEKIGDAAGGQTAGGGGTPGP